MIYLCSCLSCLLFFIYPISFLLMVMIAVDVATSLDFKTIYAESLSLETESFWTIGKSMPTPRTEVTATINSDNIYVIGGFDKSGKVLGTVEVYNVKNNSWNTVAPLPQPVHHAAATTFNGSVYVIGGYTNNKWLPSANLFIYDPKNDIWTEGSSMPTARGALTAVFIDEILYAIGGEGENEIMDINEAYNSKTKTWISKIPMPTARHHAASAVIDENVYVFGGRIEGSLPITNVNVTEMYDSKMDKWIILDPMPSKRSGISAASINNTIYVFGGEDFTKTYNNNEKYNIKDNQWESKQPLPTARHGLSAVSFHDKIYVIGGGPKPGLSVTNVNEIFNTRE
jgi:N-acetylneuraminic acid mutarotase